MKTFTFFLDDDTIHEVAAPDADDAMRTLCRQLGRSWVALWPHIIDCLSL